MERLYTLKKYGLSMLAGVCLGGSLLYPWSWPLVFVGGVVALYSFGAAHTPKEAALFGLVVGSLRSVVALLWGFTTHPLEWIGMSAPALQFFLISLYMIPSAIVLGSGMAVLGYIYRRFLHKKYNVWLLGFCFAILWVLAEVLGALLFSVYMLGPGATVNVNYSFGHSGYALVPHQLLFQFAAAFGVYGLSFIVGLLSGIFYWLSQYKRTWAYIFAGAVLASAFVPIPTTYSSSVSSSVAAIGTQFTFTHKELTTPEEEQDILLWALKASVDTSAEYVLFPEDTSLLESFSNPQSELGYLESLSDTPRVYLTSTRFDGAGETYLRAYMYDTHDGDVYTFDKQYLVPQGEYMPYLYGSLMRVFLGEGVLMERLRQDSVYRPGVSQETISLPSYAPAVLFCFESVAPFGVRRALAGREQVPFVAHIVSHAWFDEPHTLWNQLDAMLLVQAKFNHIPIVQVANLAPVKVYYPDGRIVYPEMVRSEPLWSVGLMEL